MSTQAYAVSVPHTTRVFRRKHIPMLMVLSSGFIFIQGFFRETLSFTVLRMAQCFFLSAGPALLLGGVEKGKSNKGLALGILNSGRFIGNAPGPFIASGFAYEVNLAVAFTATALFSSLAVFTTIPFLEHTKNSK